MVAIFPPYVTPVPSGRPDVFRSHGDTEWCSHWNHQSWLMIAMADQANTANNTLIISKNDINVMQPLKMYDLLIILTPAGIDTDPALIKC